MVTEERCTSRRRGKREGNKDREKNFLKHKIPQKKNKLNNFAKQKYAQMCTHLGSPNFHNQLTRVIINPQTRLFNHKKRVWVVEIGQCIEILSPKDFYCPKKKSILGEERGLFSNKPMFSREVLKMVNVCSFC